MCIQSSLYRQQWIDTWDANEAWKKRIGWIITSQIYRDDDGISGEPTEFRVEFTMMQFCGKVTDLLSRLGETPETFT